MIDVEPNPAFELGKAIVMAACVEAKRQGVDIDADDVEEIARVIYHRVVSKHMALTPRNNGS